MTSAPRKPFVDTDIQPLTSTEIDVLVADIINRDAATPTQEPDRARRSRSKIAAAVIAATAALLATLSVTGAVPNTRAVAWSAVPAAPSTADRERHGQQCIDSATDPIPTDDSAGNQLPPPTAAPTGSSLTVELSEDRNGSNATLLSNGSVCLSFSDGTGPGGVYNTSPPPRPDGDRIVLAAHSLFSSGTPAEEGSSKMRWESFWIVTYVAGPDVAGAVITTHDGTEVTATVANGWILAWWPTDDNPDQTSQIGDEDTITITATTGERYSQPVRYA